MDSGNAEQSVGASPRGKRTGVILFAHGSPVAEANEGVAALARRVASGLDAEFVTAAFLDSAQPDLGAAAAEAVRRGVARLVVMPYFLTLGLHLRRDLPRLVADVRARHPQIEILVSESLEGFPGMADAVLGRVHEALGAAQAQERERVEAPGGPNVPPARKSG